MFLMFARQQPFCPSLYVQFKVLDKVFRTYILDGRVIVGFSIVNNSHSQFILAFYVLLVNLSISKTPTIKHVFIRDFSHFRNLMGDDDCLKPSLTEMKLEPADNDGDLIQSPNIRKADKVSI